MMKLSHFFRRARLLALCLCLIGIIPLLARAQAPEIGGLLPGGGPRGQVTHVRIDGKNLAGARLHLAGGGIAIKSQKTSPNGEQLDLELAVDASARLGPHEVRITTTRGVSNGARFWVDLYPNYVIEQPMQETTPPVALDGMAPVVVNGRIAARAGRDRFTLTAAAGDTWVFDCFADRIRSRFDPVIEIKNEAGVSLLLAQSTWESDPRCCYRFAKAGRYSVTIRDSEYNGGPNYTYRLLAGRLPFVDGYVPRGERPGHQVQLALHGTGLTAATASVSIPPDAAPGTYWAEVQPGGDKPMILPLLVGSEPVLTAGNTDVVLPLPAAPIAVDGVFSHTPRARYAFQAKAKTSTLFDLLGRRIGSRIDGAIRVLDAAGKEIAANDDAPGLGKEARLLFTAPTDGNYIVEVSNVEEITGVDCYYRLKVRAIPPDFQLAIATDRLTIPQGGTISLPVSTEREGGFDGPIEVHLEGLPAGVTAAAAVIAAGKPSVEVALKAAPNTALIDSEVHVLGKAMIGGKPVTHEAPAWERYEHRSIDLLLSVEFSYTRPYHLWDMLLLAVTPAEPPKK
jgi:hypothetical protein